MIYFLVGTLFHVVHHESHDGFQKRRPTVRISRKQTPIKFFFDQRVIGLRTLLSFDYSI